MATLSSLEVIGVRHGHPERGSIDPGLNPQYLHNIAAKANYIAEILAGASAQIITSPKQRTIQTAQHLADTSEIASLLLPNAITVSHFLDDEMYAAKNQTDRSWGWTSLLTQAANHAKANSSTSKAGVIIVSHEPVLWDLYQTHAAPQPTESGYLAMNHFSFKIGV